MSPFLASFVWLVSAGSADASTLIGNPTLKVLPDGVDGLHVQAVRVMPCAGGGPTLIAVAPPGGNLVGVALGVPAGVWCGVGADVAIGGTTYPDRLTEIDPEVESTSGATVYMDVFVAAGGALWADIHD